MSGLIVGLVIRTPISERFVSTAKYVAIIYADHAWEDGSHAHPAVETVARAIGVDERTVQRHLRALVGLGMLIPDGKGPHGTNRYKFPLEETADGFVKLALRRGDTVPPRQFDGGDTDSGDTDSGDTGVTQLINPPDLVVVVNGDFGKVCTAYEQEFGALTPMIADAVKDSVDTYTAEWVLEAMDIAVKSNVRSWKYVEGILKNCRSKNVRPSLNRMEKKSHANNNNNSGAAKRVQAPLDPIQPTDADRLAAERVKARRRGVPSVP